MTNDQTSTQPAAEAERRAAVVAGIRALADLIEFDTSLPVPNSVRAQHSITRDIGNDDTLRVVRGVAAHLGIEAAEAWNNTYLRVDDDSASVQLSIASGYTAEQGSFSVSYVVHGALSTEGGEQA
jgi:hypothetical protein